MYAYPFFICVTKYAKMGQLFFIRISHFCEFKGKIANDIRSSLNKKIRSQQKLPDIRNIEVLDLPLD